MGCDPTVLLHDSLNNDESMNSEDENLVDADNFGNHEESKWNDESSINDLMEGGKYDALNPLGEWVPCEILKISGNFVLLHYTYFNKSWDEWIPIDLSRFALLGSKKHLYNSRHLLKPGQKIEALYRGTEWKEAVVVDIVEDNVHIRYVDLNTDHDEMIPISSARISWFGANLVRGGTHTKEMRKSSVNPSQDHSRVIQTQNPQYHHYCTALAEQGLRIVEVEGDGNCLFRSVSHQVYGDEKYHALVRARCMDYMTSEKEYFEPYVVGDMNDFMRYVEMKRKNAAWGDDPEIQALCELYDRPTEVFAYDSKTGARKLRTFHENRGAYRNRPVIRLSYYGGGHYDSICGDDHEYNLIREKVGVFEQRTIEYSQWKHHQVQCNGENLDPQAIEMAQMEMILKLSREEFDNQGDNLEESLKASMAFLEDQEVKIASQESDLYALQAEMIQSAQKQSEEEQIKKAVEESLKDASTQSYDMEDGSLNAAILASLDESDSLYDVDLKKALEMSLSPDGVSTTTTPDKSTTQNNLYLIHDGYDNQELQQAIQESLRQQQ